MLSLLTRLIVPGQYFPFPLYLASTDMPTFTSILLIGARVCTVRSPSSRLRPVSHSLSLSPFLMGPLISANARRNSKKDTVLLVPTCLRLRKYCTISLLGVTRPDSVMACTVSGAVMSPSTANRSKMALSSANSCTSAKSRVFNVS